MDSRMQCEQSTKEYLKARKSMEEREEQEQIADRSKYTGPQQD